MAATRVERGDVVLALCTKIRATVSDFNLVRPYNGELDRFSKKQQLQAETFAAEVNLTTPFALVISKERKPIASGPSTKLQHDLSVYIGTSKVFAFGSEELPPVFDLIKKTYLALDGAILIAGAGPLQVESDGQYLITTDLFTVYEQRYFQYEISR